jgi:hypothetical protein
MALKQMAFTPLASQEQSGLENLSGNNLEENVNAKLAEPNSEDSTLVNSDVSSVITDEVLRNRIRVLIDEEKKPKPSIWQRFSTHPLTIVFLSFLLSIPLGGFLTNHYTNKQQELMRQRSFSDELNKIRIQKIGEVWEQIDRTESDVDLLLERVNKASALKTPRAEIEKDIDNITSLVKEELAIINKNRFWLGEQTYNQIEEYLHITGSYTLDRLMGDSGIDLSETLKKRVQAKQDILKIRSMFLKGEPELDK